MARLKLKLGDAEIEVDSRDFYVDNQTLGSVIENILQHLPKNNQPIIYENPKVDSEKPRSYVEPNQNVLDYLEDAEMYEPEFNQPIEIEAREIKGKLRILETSGFFNSPRTVTETVQQLREYGWSTSPLEVSKSLAKMASTKEILKNSIENRSHYFVPNTLTI